MNVIARLEYELAYYNSAIHPFNHYTTNRWLKQMVKMLLLLQLHIYAVQHFQERTNMMTEYRSRLDFVKTIDDLCQTINKMLIVIFFFRII